MDAGQQLLDIATMAVRMGITPEAVRKRIARGTLQATKRDGRWYVVAFGPSRTDIVGRPVQDDQDNKAIASVARRMGIAPGAVRKAIARGTLQVTKRGGRWYAGASGSSGPSRTDGDGRPVQDDQDDQDNKGIASVAGRMGITPEAVRKRIARGTLQATKRDGRWYVGASGPSRTDGVGRPVQDVQDNKGIASVAGRMGITPEAVRKRIARGTLQATKRDGRWYVGAPDPSRADGDGRPVQDQHDDKDGFGQVLLAQLIAKDRQISELHRLLAKAAPPPARSGRPWWLRLLGRA